MSYLDGNNWRTYIMKGLQIIFFSNILNIKSLNFLEYNPGKGLGFLNWIADIKLARPYYLKGGSNDASWYIKHPNAHMSTY